VAELAHDRRLVQRPDDLLTFRIARLLLLLDVVARLELKKPLDIERLGFYDFFAANPFLAVGDDEAARREVALAGFSSYDLSYQSSGHRFVNRRALYRKRDGSPVEVNQVHARTNNYTDLFEKDGPKVRLKEGARVMATQTPNVVMFKDDDDGFFAWQVANPEGQFINTERKPNPNYLVLHNSGCPHFKGADSLQWTKDYVKVASADRHALERWARDTIGGEITLCRTCFGH
jgi:hypothetical protein